MGDLILWILLIGAFVLSIGTLLCLPFVSRNKKLWDRVDNINQVKFLSRHYPFSRSRPEAPKTETKEKEYAVVQEVDGKLIATLNGITYTLEKVKE